MEPIGGPVVLPQRPEDVLAHAMEVEVVARRERAGAQGARAIRVVDARTMTAGRAVVPVVLPHPRVPRLVHEVPGA